MSSILHLRRKVEIWHGGPWETVVVEHTLDPGSTALLLCDMWDDHWCRAAARRCDVIAQRMNVVVAAARAQGIQIIHAPSDCMEFYRGVPQRERMASIERVEPPLERALAEPPLPIDDSDGGCDDDPPALFRQAWTRQHAAIEIAAPDVISDHGGEIYSLLRQRTITTLLLMGVHTNMCVLGRSFGIRQMTRWGVNCVLVRDLTDAMYNPARAPFVTHEQGTDLVVEHIERYLCPTITGNDLLQ